jgi:nucleoid-associated protein YgaU
LAQVQPAAGLTTVASAIPVPATPPPQGVVAVATPRSGEGASRVLQVPGDGAKGDAAGVSVDIVDYDEKGDLILSGRGVAGSNVTIYLNNQPIGQATVDKARQWQMKPAQPVQPGQYQMRADETSPQGKVSSRIELPFMRAEAQRPATAGETRIIVQPGNSLWRIARHRYGEGQRFSVIYAANKEQIRDPDLIYPGQVFAMPSVN